MKDYYTFLKEEMDNFGGEFEPYILYVPELFKLLCSLVEENLEKSDKKEIFSALAYFVIPNDVIPDNIYGPQGYVDDIFVCVNILQKILNKYGIKFLEQYWDQDEKLEEVLKVSYEKSKQLLTKKGLLEQVLALAALE